MPTLLLRLAGPMQSWGVQSRFSERDTLLEPSKSGVIGLLCAAIGVDRSEPEEVLQLASLRMGVRVDREGTLAYDYQTAQNVLKSRDARVDARDNTVQSWRYYLADAVFLVGLEGKEADYPLLERAWRALENPRWPLFLGRKGYIPSGSLFLARGLRSQPLLEALSQFPYCGYKGLEKPLRYIVEARDGATRNDVPIAAFSERRYGSRFVQSQSRVLGEAPDDVPF